jgi:hypothetical protein
MQADGIGAGVQHVLANRLVQAVQGAAQARAALAPITLGPQHRRERVAAVCLTTHHEVDEQRQRLAQLQLDWSSVALQARGAQDQQLQVCHHLFSG